MGVHSFKCSGELIGSYVGDHWQDDEFAARLKRIHARLNKSIGIGHYGTYWSPAAEPEIRIMTQEQKYKRAVSMTYNKHRRAVTNLIYLNSMFLDDELADLSKKLYSRIEVLRKRYFEPDPETLRQMAYQQEYKKEVERLNSRSYKSFIR